MVMRVNPKLGHTILRSLVALTALIVIVGFFAERQSFKDFCAEVQPNMSGDTIDSVSEAKGYHFVDPPDGPAFIGRNSAYLPFRFETCNLEFDSLARHNAPVKSVKFDETNFTPEFWNYDLPTSVPFFVFVVCCNLMLALYGNGRGSRITGLLGVGFSIAFLLLAIDQNNKFYAGSIIGYDRVDWILDSIKYLGFAMCAVTLLSMVLLFASGIKIRSAARASKPI